MTGGRRALAVTWPQVLAWRLRRQLLDPVGTRGVADVVRRLGAVQAQVASSAELAIRLRRRSSRRGEVARALSEGRLIKTWAMRGTLHLLTPEEGGAFLAVVASGRSWERPSWQRYFGVTTAQLERLRGVIRDAIAERPLTREELIAAVARRRGFGAIADELRSGWGTLLKPVAWQGDLCFGPSQGTRVTFTTPQAASDRWAGLPSVDDAARMVIRTYLGAYGPGTIDAFKGWVSGGWFGARQLRAWFGSLDDELVEVSVEGEPAFLLAEHADELARTRPARGVRLLPGFDQYVLGPGTKDGHVVPASRRAIVSRQSGWISPVVLVSGVAAGTWELDDDEVRVTMASDAGRVPRTALSDAVARLADLLGRDLRLSVT